MPDVLVIDKPAGLVVHPSPGHSTGTLVNALLARGGVEAYGQVAGEERPGIVHRLDRDTSGLIVIARNDKAQAALMAQLKARRVKKTYLALVSGSPAAEVGRIEAPIGRDPRQFGRMAVVSGGKMAVTGYRVRERLHGWTLLEVDLHTGRTHQIRVHLSSIGHPIAGDPVYATGEARRGPDGLERLFLHSWRIEFASPSGEKLIRAEAPLPAELEACPERPARDPPMTDSGVAMAEQVIGAPGAMVVIISGPSGVGKDTVLDSLKTAIGDARAALRRDVQDPASRGRPRSRAFTTTSSPKRSSADSTTPASCSRRARTHDHWAGTPRDQVVAAVSAGRDAILKIDVNGADKVKAQIPDALLIFVNPPSSEELERRIVGRQTESPESLAQRRRDAVMEMARAPDYDYVVTNLTDKAHETADEIDEIIRKEHARHHVRDESPSEQPADNRALRRGRGRFSRTGRRADLHLQRSR